MDVIPKLSVASKKGTPNRGNEALVQEKGGLTVCAVRECLVLKRWADTGHEDHCMVS